MGSCFLQRRVSSGICRGVGVLFGGGFFCCSWGGVFCGGAFCLFLKKVYKDGERSRGTILKRVNGIPGLSHEKQGMPPKLGEDEKMGHGYVSR